MGTRGTQGGSVTSSQFRIRGIARDPTKPAAQALSKRGVEVVSADMNDKGAVRRALEGAHSVFLVTNFWEGVDTAKERRTVVDVATALSVFPIQTSSPPPPHTHTQHAIPIIITKK